MYFKIFFSIFFPVDKTPNGFPVITVSPNVRVIEMGHTAVMQCKATGNPPPEIYWLKDTKRVDMGNKRYTLIAGKYKKKLFMFFIYLRSDTIWKRQNLMLLIHQFSFYFHLYIKQENRFE